MLPAGSAREGSAIASDLSTRSRCESATEPRPGGRLLRHSTRVVRFFIATIVGPGHDGRPSRFP